MACLKLSYLRVADTVEEKSSGNFLRLVGENQGSTKESCNKYTFGFQGQEMDNEWTSNTGSHLAFKYRIHDARLGRFLSIDPLTGSYPHNSPYAFSENSTIAFFELEGLERYFAPNGDKLGQVGDNTEIKVVNEHFVETAKENIVLINSGFLNPGTSKLLSDDLLLNSTNLEDYATDVEDILKDYTIPKYKANETDCYTAASTLMGDASQEYYTGGDKTIWTDVNNNEQERTGSTFKLNGEDIQRWSLEENKVGGTIYTITQLKKGNPVLVGVSASNNGTDVMPGKNPNALTRHFVVISGIKNKKMIYKENVGPKTDKFDINFETGAMTDSSVEQLSGADKTEVSQVQKNVE